MYMKPLPHPTPLTAPFWAACREHRLVLQRCQDCGAFRFYPSEGCPRCASTRTEWTPVSGRGRVYSWTVIHRAIDPAWGADVPFVVAIVEIAEQPGVLMPGTLTGIDPQEVSAGLDVEVWFDDVTEEVTLPRWKPV